ncbi:hypothetical protein L6452_05693 [Arctium lappa]|uniref:Uncharacterized protein n=1 Tax=Arctium lappa TaxID=4217 RepID=A0ACB9EI61_ARCLA|nr:hypothetical protein L6452_05693 [Arctium lappa]
MDKLLNRFCTSGKLDHRASCRIMDRFEQQVNNQGRSLPVLVPSNRPQTAGRLWDMSFQVVAAMLNKLVRVFKLRSVNHEQEGQIYSVRNIDGQKHD